jgi:transposase-like protein
MAERRTRRSFTREFKAQAVKRLLEGGRGLSEVATELGIIEPAPVFLRNLPAVPR